MDSQDATPTPAKTGRSPRAGVLRYSAVELLVALVVLLVAFPFADEMRHGRIIETALLTLVLCMAVLAVGARRRTLAVGVVLGALAVAGQWADQFRAGVIPPPAIVAASLVFVVFVVSQLLRFILRAPLVNLEVLSAGISAYLLLAMVWSLLYTFIAHLNPNSFAFAQGPGSGQSMTGFTSLYFSMVTICTVGYGDVVPVSGVARMLASAEAVTGMLFVTVLIARLVALYSTERSSEGRDKQQE